MDDKNLRIWKPNCQTDPAITKHVQQRGGFTAIDAYHQILNATKFFGPVGAGWGWRIDQTQVYGAEPRMGVIVTLEFWYIDPDDEGKKKQFSVAECAELMYVDGQGKTRTDSDAVKKATTGAITKALSYIGFNADVFLGLFDSNKYVEKQKARVAEERNPTAGTGGTPQSSESRTKGQSPSSTEEPRPPWWTEGVKTKNARFADKTWEHMASGGVDGGRHGWLRTVARELGEDHPYGPRAAWILRECYDDTEYASLLQSKAGLGTT